MAMLVFRRVSYFCCLLFVLSNFPLSLFSNVTAVISPLDLSKGTPTSTPWERVPLVPLGASESKGLAGRDTPNGALVRESPPKWP